MGTWRVHSGNAPATARRPRAAVILLATLIAVLALVVGYGSAAASTGAGNRAGDHTGIISTNLANTVVIKNFAFGPSSLVVAPGTKVNVMNMDKAPHSVTAVNKSFDTGTIAGGQSGTFTAPNAPGTYSYICTIHPSMTGTLIVK